jgi:hypothetical protein
LRQKTERRFVDPFLGGTSGYVASSLLCYRLRVALSLYHHCSFFYQLIMLSTVKRIFVYTAFLGLGGSLSLTGIAQGQEGHGVSSGQLLPLDPAVRTGKLANGLTYFIRRNTEPKNRVVLYLPISWST